MVYSCDCGAIVKSVNALNDVMRDIVCPRCHSKLKDNDKAKDMSLLSFIQLDEAELGEMRQKIYNELSKGRGTDRELAVRLGFSDPNKVRPRRNELVGIGLIKDNGKDVCSVSNKKATMWDIL